MNLSPTTTQEDCFSNLIQDFLVCTTIHKARHLGIFTGETYVRVTLDKSRHCTKTFANSENPYYNEYFVFETRCTLNQLLRLTILYEVRKHATCRKDATIGELLIDLQSVWNQATRCYFKKWGRLEVPIDATKKAIKKHEKERKTRSSSPTVIQAATPRSAKKASKREKAGNTGGSDKETADGHAKTAMQKGFLQIDLAIITQSASPVNFLKPIETDSNSHWNDNHDYDDIERNLIQGSTPTVECNIRYKIIFYHAVLPKKSDYLIQFKLHPFKGRTSVCKGTDKPQFNETVTFSWIYPSLAQTFLVQVMSRERFSWNCIAEYELHFDEVAFRDKPNLGPTYLHFYDPLDATNYIGRLLMEIQSECLFDAIIKRDMSISFALPIDEKRWWQSETFFVEFVAIRGDFLHGNFSNCKISLKVAEHTSNSVECFLRPYKGKSKSETHLKYFRQDAPYKAIHVKMTQPDYRHKYDSDYFINEILDYMESEIEAFKLFQLKYNNQFQMHTKCLNLIIKALQKKIKEGIDARRLEYSNVKDPTPWDINRLAYLQDTMKTLIHEFDKMLSRLKVSDQKSTELVVREVLQDLMKHIKDMSVILISTRVQDEWPDLFLEMTAAKKGVAICRLNAKAFLGSTRDRELSPSSDFWRSREFVFRDINCRHSCQRCGCVVAIVQGTIGICTESERANVLRLISSDWKQTEEFYYSPILSHTTYKCRIFLHQAKVRPGNDRDGLCDAYVRLIFDGKSAETPVERGSLSPIWNIVVIFEGISLPGSIAWYERHAPLLAIELYDTDKKTADDYLGCGLLPVSVISRNAADFVQEDDEESNQNTTTKPAFRKYRNLKNTSPPSLKWVAILANGVTRAEVLVASELVEDVADSTNDTAKIPESVISAGIPKAIRPNMKNYVLQAIFAGLRHYNKTFTGRHKIKVMMGDLVLASGLSMGQERNSINFLTLHDSGIVSLPEQLEYWPAIIVSDVVVGVRGNETILGAMLISDSKRYLEQEGVLAEAIQSKDNGMDSNRGSALVIDNVNDEESRTNKINIKKVFRRFFIVTKAINATKHRAIMRKQKSRRIIDQEGFSWWTKFYNALQGDHDNSKHTLKIFDRELERYAEFSYLTDWAEPIRIVHGVRYKKNSASKEEAYATLKLHLKITPCHDMKTNKDRCVVDGDGSTLQPLATALNPTYQAQLQNMAEPCKIVVRIYIVQGLQFRPRDKFSQSDSYVRLHLGSKSLNNRAEYVRNQSNPIFGKCFQMECLMPREHVLEIAVFDRNTLRDDIIGTTLIDLEDRWRSKHRATVGIAYEYSKSGYNKWRNVMTPYEILNELCTGRDIKPPKFVDNSIEVDGITFNDETRIDTDEDLQERLSLTVLHNLSLLPSFGYKLVPEHVETRSLYRNDYPGIEQGKIQLWLELYEANITIPPAIDITPQQPEIYELRVTVWNCADVMSDDKNIFGTRMSDIFVRGWCHDAQQAQNTDIHYRSLNGEGNFNWRMIFPIRYSAIEDMMVIKHKSGILEEYETKQPPVLYLQVWDNDFMSKDDFLGALEINLANFTEPYHSRNACCKGYNATAKRNLLAFFGGESRSHHAEFAEGDMGSRTQRNSINLFQSKRIKGWFPMRGPRDAEHQASKTKLSIESAAYAGKIELELEMLTQSEASVNPVGLGRSAPNPLPLPERPDTSFNPLMHPLKSFRLIIWPGIRKYVCLIILILLAVLVCFGFFYNLPAIIVALLT